ncbi:hypothetical protein OU658_00760, partial [Escherichia coli]|nr:hypothetical protein [Escherichia coli]
ISAFHDKNREGRNSETEMQYRRANPVRGRVTKKRNISLFTERVDVDIQCPMQCVRVVVLWFQADIN